MLLSILIQVSDLIAGFGFFMLMGIAIGYCIPDPEWKKEKTKIDSKVIPMPEDIESYIGSDRLYEWRKAESKN